MCRGRQKIKMNEKFYKLQCPTCSRRLKISSRSLAKSIVCPRCNAKFSIDTDSNSVVAEDNDLFGPPVSEEFSSERMEGDAFENLDIDKVVTSNRAAKESKAAKPESVDVLQAGAGSSANANSAAEQWQQEKKVQSKLDESLQRNGIGLLILSIGLAAVPFIAGKVEGLNSIIHYLPAVAVVVAFMSSFMLAFSLRRSSITAILMCAVPFLLIGVVSMVGYFLFLAPNSTRSAVEEEQLVADEELQKDESEDLLLDKDAVENNVAAQFVPPQNRNRENIRRPVNPEKAPEIPQPERKVETEVSSFKPSELDIPKIAETKSELREELVAGAVATDNRWKLEKLLTRMNTELSKGGFSHDKIRSGNFPRGLGISKLVGKSSVFGLASYTESPILGFDICHQAGLEDIWIDLIVPVRQKKREFEDSFVVPENARLVGIRFNMDQVGILGVQPVYRIGDAGNVYGPWSGQAAAHEDRTLPELISETGVFGFVLYRDQLNLIGVRLITNSASDSPIH